MSDVGVRPIGRSSWWVDVDGVAIPAIYVERVAGGVIFQFPSENGVEVHAGPSEDGEWLVSAEGPADEPWYPHYLKDGVLYRCDPNAVDENDRLLLSLFGHTILTARTGAELLAACRALATAPVRPLADLEPTTTTGGC